MEECIYTSSYAATRAYWKKEKYLDLILNYTYNKNGSGGNIAATALMTALRYAVI